jgi:protein farnesyltransferase subunit beta
MKTKETWVDALLFFWDNDNKHAASYTIFCVAKLLNILTPTLAGPLSISFIASCQTYEGGFGGEPFTEAHGGYAYCAVAALELVGQLNDTAGVDMSSLRSWLVRRQMSYEGGFSGRSNKLVDGCYSFWQGGALAIVSAHYGSSSPSPQHHQSQSTTSAEDPWLPSQQSDGMSSSSPLSYALLFDKPMLQRYILLCAQDVNGGLRDKPSKPRDFYHTCYNLSGLSLAQHCGSASKDDEDNTPQENNYGHPTLSKVAASHPCYNVRLERVQVVLDHFKNYNSS